MKFQDLLAGMISQGKAEKALRFKTDALKCWGIVKRVAPEVLQIFGFLDAADWFRDADDSVVFEAGHLEVAQLIMVGRMFEEESAASAEISSNSELIQEYINELRGSNAYTVVNPKYLQ